MKKSIFIALALLASASGLQAQTTEYYNTRHEVSFALGGASNTTILGDLLDFTQVALSATVTSMASLGTYTAYYTYGDEHYVPTHSFEYYYHVNKVVALGGVFAFNGVKRDMYMEWTENNNGTHHRDKVGKAVRRNFTLLPSVKFDWLRREHFDMYSKVGIGATWMHQTQKDDADGGTDYSEDDVIFNFQLTGIGMEAGSEKWRGFLELGMGEQGIALMGVKYKF